MNEKTPKRLLKLKLELLLTILCLMMIHSLATRELALPAYRVEIAYAAPTPPADTAPSMAPKIPSGDPYEIAESTKNPKTLEALAEAEAQRMIQTGDTARYREQLEKYGVFLSIAGY